MQLNLFEWDLIAIANGYKRLIVLEFDEARSVFQRILQTIPDHPRAVKGIREVQFWQDGVS